MNQVDFDGVTVDYELTGSGGHVVLVHAWPFVGWYVPLIEALSDHSVLSYRRSVPLDGRPFSIDDDAAVCARLLDHVGFERPHVVGHSYGALLALALARSRTGGAAPRSPCSNRPAAACSIPSKRPPGCPR